MSLEHPIVRKAVILRRFSSSAPTYDRHASIQERVAARLAGLLPGAGAGNILELGCGTGLFTGRLLERYPGARFLVTDISPRMVSHCVRKYRASPNLTFKVMDGDSPLADGPFDLIASSMSLQWFADPVESITRQREAVSSQGAVVYATLGPDNFPEWRETLEKLGKDVGLLNMPPLPGAILEERIRINYRTGQNFLATLRASGSDQPRSGYRPLSPLALKRVCGAFNRVHGGCVTWHIVYGCATASARSRGL